MEYSNLVMLKLQLCDATGESPLIQDCKVKEDCARKTKRERESRDCKGLCNKKRSRIAIT